MSVAKNLMFQKKYYPNIYNGYISLYDECNEELIEELEEDSSDKVILIVADEFADILKTIFTIPNSIIEDEITHLEEFEEIYIYKSTDENIKIKASSSSIKIRCMHMYSFTNYIIKLIKNTNKQSFKDASIVYMTREPSIYEKVYLKESASRLITINNIDDLKNHLIKDRITYNESMLISKLNVEKKLEVKNAFGESYYKVSLSLDLIRNIVEMGLINEDRAIINQYIYSTVLDEYRNEGKKIIDPYITKDFVRNYMIIDRFLLQGEELSNSIVDMIKGEISKEITDFKTIPGTAELYVNLLGSSIKNIDGVLSYNLDKLHKNVNII